MTELISRIEKELNNSTLTEYRCENGTVIKTDVGYVEDWFKEWKQTLPNQSWLNTGLTDAEKESLLKFFITHCTVKQLDEEGIRFEVSFFNNPEKVTKDTATTIATAMMNLQRSVWGV